MPDLPVFRMLQKAQREIIVLRSIKLRSQRSGFPDNTCPVYSQMVRIHHGEKCVRRPVWFKERIMPPGPVLRQLVFITVYKVQLRILIQLSGHLIQRIRRQDIVAVQKSDKVSLCQGNSIIRCSGNPAILFPVDDIDPITPLIVLQDFSHGRHARMIIDKDQLPLFPCLGGDRLNAGAQHLAFNVVHRHNDRKQRLIGKSLDRIRIGLILHDPLVISRLRGRRSGSHLTVVVPKALHLCRRVDVPDIRPVAARSPEMNRVLQPELAGTLDASDQQTLVLPAFFLPVPVSCHGLPP